MLATVAPRVAATSAAEAPATDTATSTSEPVTPTALPTQAPPLTAVPATPTRDAHADADGYGQPFDPATLSLDLEQIANGLDPPVFATHAGDGSGRLFVVEKKGQIQVLDADGLLSQPFLDIRKRVGSGSSEQGLLGLGLSPELRPERPAVCLLHG